MLVAQVFLLSSNILYIKAGKRSLGVEIEGLKPVRVKLRKLGTRRFNYHITKAQKDTARKVRDRARYYVPYDTGATSKSIKVENRVIKGKQRWVDVTSNTYYSLYIHEGIHINFRREKNPNAQAKYLSQALYENVQLYFDNLRSGARDLLDEVGK